MKAPDVNLPLARVRRLMKRDGEVKAVSKDAAVCAAKAAELFISLLASSTLQQSAAMGKKKAKTLDELSLHEAIHNGEDCFEFLAFDFDKPAQVRKRIANAKKTAGARTVEAVGSQHIAQFFTSNAKG